MRPLGLGLAAVLAAVFLAGARAGAVEESRALTIKDHRFDPAVLEVPAGVKVKLTVRNLDSTPEEFDSHALNREKVISGGGEAQIWIGPLDAGSYDFMGEYHADTALGKVIAK